MFFYWRGSGASHRPPIATEWVMDLLRNTLELDKEMLQDMGGAIRSEIFCAALIMMQALSSVLWRCQTGCLCNTGTLVTTLSLEWPACALWRQHW